MIDWQKIDTIPKDETYVLLYFPTGDSSDPSDHYKIGFWSVAYADWFDWEGASNSLTAFGHYPSHWAKLDKPT